MPDARPFTAFLDDARRRVDEALDRYLPREPSSPPLLSQAIRYSVFAGGKRLRPLLTLAAADAVARVDRPSAPPGVVDAALPVACAIEMIHTYSLIHDDLPSMDNDTLRRGRPTLHTVYGDGIAILAGDALQAEAFGLLAGDPATNDSRAASRQLRVLRLVAQAAGAAGMVGGQVIDLQAAGQVAGHVLALDPDGLRAMHAKKTGALIGASAVAGAIVAGADANLERQISSWAADIGLAFQIVDDVLDVEGSAENLGKTAGKDAAGEKPTYPSLFGLDRSKAMASECAARAHAILAGAGLLESGLDSIARWVIARSS